LSKVSIKNVKNDKSVLFNNKARFKSKRRNDWALLMENREKVMETDKEDHKEGFKQG